MIKYPFIKEIGDLSAKPYSTSEPKYAGEYHYTTEFKTDSELNYVIDLWGAVRSGYLIVKCGFYVKSGEEYDDSSITNKGEIFRILATFSKVFRELEPKFKEFADSRKVILTFRISGTKKEGESKKTISARTRIYYHFLKASPYIVSKYDVSPIHSDNSLYLIPKKDKLTEVYNPIPVTPRNIAKAAIRDIFIQMPTRTVHEMNWKGLLGQVVGIVGETVANEAVEELKNEGWLAFSEELWRWRKMFGPVNPICEQPYFPPTMLEHINAIDKITKSIIVEASNKNVEVRPLRTAEELKLYKEYILKHYLQNDAKNMKHRFGIFNQNGGKMVGVVCYGNPTDAALTRRMVDETGQQIFTPDEIYELRRLWALDDAELHNVESQAISLGNQEIVRVRPRTQVIVTYTDTSAGHTGTVYRATNAIEITSPGSKLKRYFYPVGNPTTRRVVLKKLLKYKENFDELNLTYGKGGGKKRPGSQFSLFDPGTMA